MYFVQIMSRLFMNYVKVSVILEAWKMKFGQEATVIRLVGGIQAMEMQVAIMMMMMMVMMAKLITMTYIVTMFTIIDDQDRDCDYMTINLNHGYG